MMSSHLALPREGYLAQVLHICLYLKTHYNSALLFDPTYPDVDMDILPKHDWTNFMQMSRRPSRLIYLSR